MNNDLFADAALKVLLTPQSWRIVGSLFEPEVAAVRNRRHLAWMGSHVDRHPAREILIALEGRGVYGFKGRVYPCLPGSIFLFDAYEPHDNYYPPYCQRLRHVWLYIFEHEVLARIRDVERGRITQGRAPIILGGKEESSLLIAAWNEVAAAPELPVRVKRAKMLAALAAVAARIAETGYGASRHPAGQDFMSSVIQTIQRHVDRHAGRGIPLGEAARLAGYSKFHFFRLFKQQTGATYHDYVDACRIEKARAMLAEGCRKKAIAAELGFSHTSVLLRWMKRHTPQDQNP